ncbi:MAG: desulfoferrodoxin family protein [Candidatus Treponema excrementipullorum]|nr:desulfoferrodoxin [Spirochaetia bacterium]MDY4464868.1 desulfoferrodoxin family protein [Candidatus Treponema excrementipullorum]
MDTSVKFFSCGECKSVLVGLPGAFPGAGDGVKALSANVTDAATEKHVPVVTVEGSKVSVVVGSVEHPMTEEHLINWIMLVTDKEIRCKGLKSTDKPVAEFILADDEKPLEVYEMCNLHGLWKKEL